MTTSAVLQPACHPLRMNVITMTIMMMLIMIANLMMMTEQHLYHKALKRETCSHPAYRKKPRARGGGI